MKKIVVKEIDQYTSKMFINKVVSEYLIYVITEDGVKHSAYTEIGEENKKARVNELVMAYFLFDNQNKYIIEDIIEEISFEELTK